MGLGQPFVDLDVDGSLRQEQLHGFAYIGKGGRQDGVERSAKLILLLGVRV